MFRPLLALSMIALSACTPEVQSTSGTAFLAQGAIADPDIAAAAALDPAPLNFPARIGLIRFVQGSVSTLPANERDLLISTLPKALGDITQLGTLEVGLFSRTRLHSADGKRIRELAASRHLDYVLVVSLDPHKNTAEALFMDVRTGYPHGSIETTGSGRGITNTFGYRPNNPNKINRATSRLTKALKPQLEALAKTLLADAQ
ncbi:MAG: hypothetical protein AAFZ14_03010 [Pseudomonadota bacterium]